MIPNDYSIKIGRYDRICIRATVMILEIDNQRILQIGFHRHDIIGIRSCTFRPRRYIIINVIFLFAFRRSIYFGCCSARLGCSLNSRKVLGLVIHFYQRKAHMGDCRNLCFALILKRYRLIVRIRHFSIESNIIINRTKEVIMCVRSNRFNRHLRCASVLHGEGIRLFFCHELIYMLFIRFGRNRQLVVLANQVSGLKLFQVVFIAVEIVQTKVCFRSDNPEGSIIFNVYGSPSTIQECNQMVCFSSGNPGIADSSIAFSGNRIILICRAQSRILFIKSDRCSANLRFTECETVYAVIRIHVSRNLYQTILLQHC